MAKDGLHVVLHDGRMFVRCDDLIDYLESLRGGARLRADRLDTELEDAKIGCLEEEEKACETVTESCMQSGAAEALDTVIKDLRQGVAFASEQFGVEPLDVCILDT